MLYRRSKLTRTSHRCVGSGMLDIIFGYQTKPKDDEWVTLADQVLADLDLAGQ